MVLWFVGMSSAGKTVMAKKVYDEIKREKNIKKWFYSMVIS